MHNAPGKLAQPILLIGPSTRAMACSARRAGFDPLCIDLFADTDLQAIAPVERIPMRDYPHGIVEMLRKYPADIPVLYTGGLENHPALYLAISKQRPVWGYLHPEPQHGNSIRNPMYFDQQAQQYGLHRPRHAWQELPKTGRWLVKPVSGAGGRGIVPWLPGANLPKEHYVEEFLEGPSLAVIFFRFDAMTTCIGITEQLIGASFVHAPTPYTYSGSIGPYRFEQFDDLQALLRIGQQLVKIDPALRGLFGVDLILRDGKFYVLEVNPRYTASIEVVELVLGCAFLRFHAMEFSKDNTSGQPGLVASGSNSPLLLGKAIYFAPHPITFPTLGPWSLGDVHDVWAKPSYADIPAPGTVIEKGHPVLTLFAKGKETEEVMQHLRERALELDRLFQQ